MTNNAPWLITATGFALLLSGMSCIGFFGSATQHQLSTYLYVTSVCTGIGIAFSVVGEFAVLRFMSPLALKFALASIGVAVVAYTIATVLSIMETYRVGTDLSQFQVAPFGFYFATWIISSLCMLSHASIALLIGVALLKNEECAIQAPHLCPSLRTRSS